MGKISDKGLYPEKTTLVDADYLVGTDSESGSLETKSFTMADVKTFMNKYIQLDTNNTRLYSAGQMSWDEDYFAPMVDTGVSGIRNTLGQEFHNVIYNNSGATIIAGTPLSTDLTLTGIYPNAQPSTSADTISSISFIGLADEDILDGEIGMTTWRGRIKGINTSSLTQSFIYLGENGTLTQSRPDYPATRYFIGVVEKIGITDGIINVQPRLFPRFDVSKSYSFSSAGIGSGTYWKGGFYNWALTDANLNEGNTTITWGNANQAYAAHASIVAGGAGVVVGGGQVGLRVTGIRDYEDGTPQQAGQVGIVTEDITALTLNEYAETSEKFSGNIAYELYVVSGTPTAYSLDFNYGYSKYEDMQDRDFTVTEFEAVWQGNATSALDIALMHHTTNGWNYASAGFTPGNGDICRKSIDQPLAGEITNNLDGAYKRTNINFKVEGEGMDGIIIQVVTGANSTIQTMDIHVGGVSEELLR